MVHLRWLLSDFIDVTEGDESGLELVHQWEGEKNSHEDGKELVLKTGDTATFIVESEAQE